MVMILSTRKPGFTSSTFSRLRPSSPAPTTSTKVMAICAATIERPTRWLPCEPACPRPPSSRPLRRSPEVARAAVNAPRPAATAVESKNAKTSTGILIETLSSRGRFSGARPASADTPASAPSTPRPPPASESRNASVRNWRISRPRAAPRALRMASSRSLTEAWANSKFATFAHATNNKKPTAPSRTSRAGRALPVIESWSGTTIPSLRR